MIDENLVAESLNLLGGFDDEAVRRYKPIIDAVLAEVSDAAVDDAQENDPRLAQLAAAKAYAVICAAENDDVTSFSAGDVSLTVRSASENAKAYLDAALSGCTGLLKDSGFAFMSV